MLKTQLSRIGNKNICPITVTVRDGKVLMGLRHYTPDKWKSISAWTTPGGRCDDGETIEATLRREMKEEAGITDFEIVDYIGEVVGAKEGDTVPIFFCRTNSEPLLMEPEKFSEWRWIPIKDYMKGAPDNNPMNPKAREMIKNYLKEGEIL